MAPAHHHLVGVLGQGLSALSAFLRAQGGVVTGQDAAEPDAADPLHRVVLDLGIDVGPDDGELPARCDAVVPASYVEDGHAALAAARRRGVPVVPRLAALQSALSAHEVVGVSGGTGKSTTTAVLHQLLSAEREAALYVGAACLHAGGRNYALTASGPAAVEACEFKREFLALRPQVAVVTNLLWGDHADYYATPEEMHGCFAEFARGAGRVVVDRDDAATRRLFRAERDPRVVGVGAEQGADWLISDVALARDGTRFTLTHRNGERRRLASALTGRHNVTNVALAYAAARELGASAAALEDACRGLQPVRRRVEPVAELPAGGVVVDDYAHNPAQLAAGLATVRLRWPGLPIVCVFQPSVHSRVRLQFAELGACFEGADAVALLPIQPGSRDDPRERDLVSAADLAAEIANSTTATALTLEETDAVAFAQRAVARPAVVYVAGSRRAARLVRTIVAELGTSV